MTERARDLGERALIARFTDGAPVRANPLGFSDDAAALPCGPDAFLVTSVDAFREATHFPPGMTRREAGAFVVEAAVSDLAAMGADAEGVLLALGIPEAAPMPDVDAFRDGVHDALSRTGAELLGGDTKTHTEWTATVTALGRVPRDQLLRRAGARPTDLIAVTGALGGAGAGLAALRDGLGRAHADRLLKPRARLAEGRALAGTRGTCTAAMDTSDGFARALHEIARQAGGLGFEVDASRVPVATEARAVAGDDAARALSWALHAGGDYELVVTLERTEVLDALRVVREAGGTLSVVGHLTHPGAEGVVVDADGARRPLPDAGWEHFTTRGATGSTAPRHREKR